jgi:hypothetical protein
MKKVLYTFPYGSMEDETHIDLPSPPDFKNDHKFVKVTMQGTTFYKPEKVDLIYTFVYLSDGTRCVYREISDNGLWKFMTHPRRVERNYSWRNCIILEQCIPDNLTELIRQQTTFFYLEDGQKITTVRCGDDYFLLDGQLFGSNKI